MKSKFKNLLLNKLITKIELSRGREGDNLILNLENETQEKTRVIISCGAIHADLFIKLLK